MNLKLGLHLGYASTRYYEPKIWTEMVRNEFDLNYVQFTSNLLEPTLPNHIISDEIDKIKFFSKKHNIKFDHTFTSPRNNFFGHSNKKIRNICYDINTGKLIGISSYDGQIYESRNSTGGEYVRWIGPINYDKPMKKILFNREGVMIGIGLIDNFIYKKIGKNWRYEEWDEKNINKTKVYDLFFDKDGCMIASTPNGVKKQTHQDFNSEFIDIREYKEKHEDLMNNVEIIKSRVGIEFIDDEFNTNTELGRDLKRKLKCPDKPEL